MRHGRRRVDTTQAAIVAALRAAGASVQPIYQVGHGCPDLLCGYRGWTLLFEAKSGRGDELTRDEALWHARWTGGPLEVVRTPEEALAVLREHDEGER